MSLKPCPFCLSTNIRPVVEETTDGSVHSFCSCLDCGACGPVVVSARAACAVWNTIGRRYPTRPLSTPRRTALRVLS